jgi:hypothetical protein
VNVIKHTKLGLLAIIALLVVADGSAFAQMGGMGGMGGMQMQRPKRRLHKARAPALSPNLNMVEGVPTSFEGQFLLRTQPQELALRQYGLIEKSLDKLQTEVTDTDNRVKSGIKGTGHKTSFMNYGGYYSFPGGKSGGTGAGAGAPGGGGTSGPPGAAGGFASPSTGGGMGGGGFMGGGMF